MVLLRLHRLEEACTVVRQNPKSDVAALVAEHSKKHGEFDVGSYLLLEEVALPCE